MAGQVIALKLPGRKIDTHRQIDMAGIMPETRLPTSLVQYPFPDRNDQTGLLGNRNKLIGHHQATRRVMPADQRFNPRNMAVYAMHLRLIIKLELTFLQPVTQIVFQAHALLHRPIHLLGKKLKIISPAIFGMIHRGIRISKQHGGAVPVIRIDADANARGNVQNMIIDLDRLNDGIDKLLRDQCNPVDICKVWYHDNKLIAAHT